MTNDTAPRSTADVAVTPNVWRRIPWRSIAIVFPFLAVFIALSIGSPAFLSLYNIGNVLDRQSGILIVAAASTLVLIAGGIDLSVGALDGSRGSAIRPSQARQPTWRSRCGTSR